MLVDNKRWPTAWALRTSHPPTEGEILFVNVLTYKRDHGLYVEP